MASQCKQSHCVHIKYNFMSSVWSVRLDRYTSLPTQPVWSVRLDRYTSLPTQPVWSVRLIDTHHFLHNHNHHFHQKIH